MQLDQVTIGVPREIMPGESRVAAIPDTVAKMKDAGARVLVESGAGSGAFIDDQSYSEKGAELVPDVRGIYDRADLIIKVKEPRYHDGLGMHEAELIRENGILIGFMHPANPANHEGLQLLAARKVTGYTLDGVPRISRAQQMDALTSMSTAAGYKGAIFAANRLGRFVPMMPTSFGIIKPAVFLVIGTGVAGLQAIATAKRLGAKVKTLDIRPEANEQARSLGAENIEFDVPTELAMGEGGYARYLPDEWYARERETIAPHVKESDAIILTALVPGEKAPMLIDEEMVNSMKKGSAIIDIAVDQGGNCALTRGGEEFSHNGVTVSGIMNIPATLAVDATNMFAQNLWHFLSYIMQNGTPKTDEDDEIVRGTLVTLGGRIVHQGALHAMNRKEQ